jgi:hypothetical protein
MTKSFTHITVMFCTIAHHRAGIVTSFPRATVSIGNSRRSTIAFPNFLSLHMIAVLAKCGHTHKAFTEYYDTEKFQTADAVRRDVFLAVDFMRSDAVTIHLIKIGTIFAGLKAVIVKHYKRTQTQQQRVG